VATPICLAGEITSGFAVLLRLGFLLAHPSTNFHNPGNDGARLFSVFSPDPDLSLVDSIRV